MEFIPNPRSNDRKHAPYVLTKPLHPSQKLIEKNDYGITISLEVQHNFELEKEILGLGDGIIVISPERLKANIIDRINNTIDQYNTSITEKGIISLKRKYAHKGFCVINQLYSRKSINQLGLALSKGNHLEKNNGNITIIDLNSDRNIQAIILNPTVEKILYQIVDNPKIETITYYEQIPESLFVFKQSETSIQYILFVLLSDLKSKTFSMQVIPCSQNKPLNDSEIECIVDNCIPTNCPVNIGGAILLNPVLLRRFSESFKNEKVKFLLMEFAQKNLE